MSFRSSAFTHIKLIHTITHLRFTAERSTTPKHGSYVPYTAENEWVIVHSTRLL